MAKTAHRARKSTRKPAKHAAPKRRVATKAKATPRKRKPTNPSTALLPRSPREAFNAGMERQRQLDAVIKEQLTNEPKAIRVQVLDTARDLTTGDREAAYGDPKVNLSLAAAFKEMFWRHFNSAGINEVIHDPVREDTLGRETAHGHAIDMILTNLARIATSPSDKSQLDRYVDVAGYAALAREVAERS